MNKSIWNIKLVPLERASKTDLDTYLSLCDIFYFNTNYPPISLQWVDIIEFDCWRQWTRKSQLVLCDSLAVVAAPGVPRPRPAAPSGLARPARDVFRPV